MTRTRLISTLLAAALLALCATVAASDAPRLRIHAVFSGGRADHFAVGEPLLVMAPSKGKVHATHVCWTPAPVDATACGNIATFRAPAHSGRQQIRVTLSDGTTIDQTFAVGPAASKLPVNTGTPAVPMRVTCVTRLYANGYDGHLRDEQAPIAAGQHLAAYYRVPKHPHIIQVVAYRSGNAGFVKDTCLKPVPSRTAIG